jgi:hypothetical protein
MIDRQPAVNTFVAAAKLGTFRNSIVNTYTTVAFIESAVRCSSECSAKLGAGARRRPSSMP